MHENRIVEAFNLMWNDRSSTKNGSLSDVKKLIHSELKDEFTHPRVRQSPEKKYRLAMERIENLPIEEDLKQELSRLYHHEFTAISDNVNPH